MSERSHHRRPATFKLDDPGVVVMDPDDASRPLRGTVHVTPGSRSGAATRAASKRRWFRRAAAFAGARCSGPPLAGWSCSGSGSASPV